MSELRPWKALDALPPDYFREGRHLASMAVRAMKRGQYSRAMRLLDELERYRRIARMKSWLRGLPPEPARARNPSMIFLATSPTETQPSVGATPPTSHDLSPEQTPV